MYHTNRALTPVEFDLAVIDDCEVGLEDLSLEFIQAFCELIAIQQARKTEPIVVVPCGSYTLH
jgi:hypothetical protein